MPARKDRTETRLFHFGAVIWRPFLKTTISFPSFPASFILILFLEKRPILPINRKSIGCHFTDNKMKEFRERRRLCFMSFIWPTHPVCDCHLFVFNKSTRHSSCQHTVYDPFSVDLDFELEEIIAIFNWFERCIVSRRSSVLV